MAASVGSLFVSLRLKDMEYRKGLSKAEKQALRSARVISRSFTSVSNSLDRATNRALVLGATLAAAATAFGAKKVVKDFQDFQTALVDTQKITNESMESIRSKIENISEEFGSSSELVKGYYQVLSAGVREPVRSLETLTVAAQASKAAHVEQTETVKALTKMLNTGLVKTAREASDALFQIEKVGQTTFAELVPVIGSLANLAKNLSINMDELGNTFATVTQVAGSVEESATQMRAMFIAMLKPSDKLKKVLKEMRVESVKAAVESLGFEGALKKILQTSKKLNITDAELVGRQRALLSMLSIMRNNFADLERNQKVYNETTGMTAKAFERWKGTLEGLFTTFKNLTTNIAALVGLKLEDRIKGIVTQANNWLKANKDVIATDLAKWFGEVIDKLDWIWKHKEIFTTLFSVFIIGGLANKIYRVAEGVAMLAVQVGILETEVALLALPVAGLTTFLAAWSTFIGFMQTDPNSLVAIGSRGVAAQVSREVEELKKQAREMKKVKSEIDTAPLYGDPFAPKLPPIETTKKAAEKQVKAVEKVLNGRTFGVTAPTGEKYPVLNALGLGEDGYYYANLNMKRIRTSAQIQGNLITEDSKANWKKFSENFDTETVNMSQSFLRFGDRMSNILSNSLMESQNIFKSIAQAFKRMLVVMAADMASKAAIFSIFAAMPFGGSLGIPAFGGKGFGKAMGKFLQIPGFANGGMAMKPTFAMIGENGPERVLNPQETREYNSSNDNSSQTFNINMKPDDFNMMTVSKFGDLFREAKRSRAIKKDDLQF